MGYNLLVNGGYWGYTPFTNHLLTSWDIQVWVRDSPGGYLFQDVSQSPPHVLVPLLEASLLLPSFDPRLTLTCSGENNNKDTTKQVEMMSNEYTYIYIHMPEKQTWQWWQITIFNRKLIFKLMFFICFSIVMLVSGVYIQSFEMIRNDMTWYAMIVELMNVEGRTFPLLSALCLPLCCGVTDKHGSQTTTELVNHMTWFKSKIPNHRLVDKIRPKTHGRVKQYNFTRHTLPEIGSSLK